MYSSDSDSDNDLDVVAAAPRRRVFKERINFLGEVGFKERFRFDKEGVEQLLQIVGPLLSPNTYRNYSITAQQRLLLALRFFACGSFYYTNGDCHGISKATVCRAVHDVTRVINHRIVPDQLKWPVTAAEQQSIGERFYSKASMPSVCGCIDGTLIQIKAPSPSAIEPQFVDRHQNHSINCMAVCGPEMNFYFASANWPGSANDSRVLRNSSLALKFSHGWRPFPQAFLLGDSGYPVKEWLQIPILTANPSPVIEQFNRSHKKTRRIIENAFGILKQRFQCLYYLRVSPKFAGEIFMACCGLHNILLSQQPPEMEDVYDENTVPLMFGLEEEQSDSDVFDPDNEPGDRQKGLQRQQQLLDYFRNN